MPAKRRPYLFLKRPLLIKLSDHHPIWQYHKDLHLPADIEVISITEEAVVQLLGGNSVVWAETEKRPAIMLRILVELEETDGEQD